jgi:uncharacterized protein YraI
MSSKLIAAALAAGFVMLASAGAAFASPAMVTSNVNVRFGPGPNYSVIDIVRRGEFVDLVGCQNTWCYVDRNGSEGWISAAYLDRSDIAQRPSTRSGFNIVEPPPPPSYSRQYQGGWDEHRPDTGNGRGEPQWTGSGRWGERDPWSQKFRPTDWY